MTLDFRSVLAVAFGGAVGSVLRYVVGFLVAQRLGPGFPWGTLFINVSGSLMIGAIAEFSLTRAFGVTPLVRLMLAVGILGGYTTFSTFSFDILTLTMERAQYLALAYAATSLILGFTAAFVGVVIARAIVSAH